MKINSLIIGSLLAFGLVFSACGGGGGSDSSAPSSPQNGVAYFIDSPVDGLSYKSQSKEGITKDGGAFEYAPSDTNVTFKAGEITLGTINISDINADSKLFIQDLVNVSRDTIDNADVLKIASFLQSLDTGANPNGITLDKDELLDFNESKNVKDINVSRQLAFVGKTPKNEDEVKEHLGDTMRKNGIALYNYTPQSADSNITTLKNIVTNGTLSATDKNDNYLEYVIESNATNGKVELIADSNSFKYTPNSEYIGTDSFMYKAFDGEKYSKVATVNITIEDVILTANDATPPTVPTIVSLEAQKNSLTIFWLNSTDETTPTTEIRYEVHLSTDVNFTTDSTTLKQTLINTLEADIEGLETNTLYYVKVKALDGSDNNATSIENSMQTLSQEVVLAPAVIVKKATALHLENAVEGSGSLVFEDSAKADIPNAGDILVGNAEDAYLKKVVSVDKNDSTTTLEVQDVAITDVVESAKLSSKVLLFGSGDVASTPSNAMKRSVSYSANNTKERTTTWGSGRFSVSDTTRLSKSSSSKRAPSAENNEFKVYITNHTIRVTEKESLKINVNAFMRESGMDDDWKFTKMELVSLTHSENSSSNNFNAHFTPQVAKNAATGIFKWTPKKEHISTGSYTATFKLYAEDEECSDLLDACDGDSETVDATITVIGDGKVDTGGETNKVFNSSTEFTNDVTLDFTPELIIDHEISGSSLNYAKVAINGKLDFNVLTKFAYTAAAKKTYNSQLVNKSYKSVYVAGAVPIYQEIVFTIDAELEATAEGSVTATSDLQTSFEIEAGVEFDGTNWNPIATNKLTKDYTATIEAAGGVNVKVRLIPNVEVRFYKVASAGLSVEPWLEGNLKASATATFNTDFADSDALGLHRVENLDLDVGVEAKVYADLTVWKVNLAHYPSEANDEDGDGKKTIYNPSLSVFSIPSVRLEDNGADVCNETYRLNATIENPESLVENNFVSNSVEWIVFPSAGATIMPTANDNTEATFTFDKQDNYTVYMVGNSEKLGSLYGKQYESYSIDTRGCIIPDNANDTTAPVFSAGNSLTLSVYENQPSVLTLNANDETSSVTYSASFSDIYNVHPSTGEVTFVTMPDYEERHGMVSTFYATDEAGNRAEQVVTINILNEDDSGPVFTSATTIVKSENQHDAGVLSATDESPITYSVRDNDWESFTMNSSDGVMLFINAPDFETKSTYTFTAVARDSLGYETTQSVTINISDEVEIDNTAPIFTSSTTLSVEENQQLAGRLVATDESTITYSIKDGDASDFYVTSDGGSMLFKESPDFETKSSYTFTAVATDESNNTAEQSVTITLLNIDDNPFITTWKTDNVGSSSDDQITIQRGSYDDDYDFKVDWGDGTSDSGVTGDITHTYGSAGTYMVKITGTYPGIAFWSNADNEKILSVEQWGDVEWMSMENAFSRCKNLVINATDTPNMSNVYSMANMFTGAENFNHNISNWDTSGVYWMYNLFKNALKFNQDISGLDMSNVDNVDGMFENAIAFDQNLSSWDTSSFRSAKYMFKNATLFNGDIANWDVSKVTNMTEMFSGAIAFNQDINRWNVSSVNSYGSFYGMFLGAKEFNQDIGDWNTSAAKTMESMFAGASKFNSDISGWNTSSVTNMNAMFGGATVFDQEIGNWDVSKVTSIRSMFFLAASFNKSVGDWNTSLVTNMSSVFYGATMFNQDLSNWNTSNVTNMDYTFQEATAFNGNVGSWDTSKVERTSGMFKGATSFNGNIGSWKTASVKNMTDMFIGAIAFNQDIGDWNTSNVTDMSYMFNDATAFNQDLNEWDVSKVAYMSYMFAGASSFDRALGNWDVSACFSLNHMFKDVTLSTANYDNLLIEWSKLSLKTSNVLFSAGNSTYSPLAQDARDVIWQNYNWNITDGGAE